MLSSSTFPTRPVFPGGGFVFLTRACDFSRHYFDRRRRWRHVASGVQYARARPSPGGRSGGGRAHGVSAGRRVRLSSPAPVRTRGRRGHCIIPPTQRRIVYSTFGAPPPPYENARPIARGRPSRTWPLPIGLTRARQIRLRRSDRRPAHCRRRDATIHLLLSWHGRTSHDDLAVTPTPPPTVGWKLYLLIDHRSSRRLFSTITFFSFFIIFFFLQFFTSCVCTYILRCLVGRLITENRDWNNIVFYTDGFVFENYTHEQRNVFCMV